MAEFQKITAKIIKSDKELLIAPAQDKQEIKPSAAAKARKSISKKRNNEMQPRKSGLKYLGVDKKHHKKEKHKKVKMVRDSFIMPENDYAKIAALKEKCLMAGVHVKKSELLRAGLGYLEKLSNANLLKTIKQVEKIKTGRPAKHR